MNTEINIHIDSKIGAFANEYHKSICLIKFLEKVNKVEILEDALKVNEKLYSNISI